VRNKRYVCVCVCERERERERERGTKGEEPFIIRHHTTKGEEEERLHARASVAQRTIQYLSLFIEI
jgi:glutamyl/glutaminyl-tRNA synthetase